MTPFVGNSGRSRRGAHCAPSVGGTRCARGGASGTQRGAWVLPRYHLRPVHTAPRGSVQGEAGIRTRGPLHFPWRTLVAQTRCHPNGDRGPPPPKDDLDQAQALLHVKGCASARGVRTITTVARADYSCWPLLQIIHQAFGGQIRGRWPTLEAEAMPRPTYLTPRLVVAHPGSSRGPVIRWV